MASGIFSRLYRAFKAFDEAIDVLFRRSFPPGNLYAIEYNIINQVQPASLPGKTLKDILNDAFLWAVPVKRRSLEKRLCRRFGIPQYNWKPHVPKTNIVMCRKCGHNYEAQTLCGYCYEVVKKETQLMQEAIQNALGLSPVEQDVVVLYEGEKEQKADDFWKKQRIVELPKKRPSWFDANLLQPVVEEPNLLQEAAAEPNLFQPVAEESCNLNDKKPEDDSPQDVKNN